MVKNIVVTGCNGYIAKNLIYYLNKYNIKCINRNDFNDFEKIAKIVKECHVVIHLAAITNPYDKNIWKVNVGYTKFLVNEAKRYNKKFIYLSTQNVLFGKDNYSKTKRESEKIVKELKNYVILRPTIIYGKNENKYIGKLINLIKSSLIIPVIGRGDNKIQPIYIEDLMRIIEKCINKNINGIFLIAGSSTTSYNELINLIIRSLNLKRIKIHISILLLRPFAYILQWFKNPLITNVQLDNLKINQDYDIKNIKKIFNIKLTTINDGINKILK